MSISLKTWFLGDLELLRKALAANINTDAYLRIFDILRVKNVYAECFQVTIFSASGVRVFYKLVNGICGQGQLKTSKKNRFSENSMTFLVFYFRIELNSVMPLLALLSGCSEILMCLDYGIKSGP